MGWYEVALQKYEFVVRDFPTHPDGYTGVGRTMYDLIVHKGSKAYDKAIFALKNASEIAVADPEPDYLAGIIYRDYKHYPELALEHLAKALARASEPSMKEKVRAAMAEVQK
jgi:tetratricopeptide (TPR) repeat protein